MRPGRRPLGDCLLSAQTASSEILSNTFSLSKILQRVTNVTLLLWVTLASKYIMALAWWNFQKVACRISLGTLWLIRINRFCCYRPKIKWKWTRRKKKQPARVATGSFKGKGRGQQARRGDWRVWASAKLGKVWASANNLFLLIHQEAHLSKYVLASFSKGMFLKREEGPRGTLGQSKKGGCRVSIKPISWLGREGRWRRKMVDMCVDLQVGQDRISCLCLHSSQMRCPLLHWKIRLGGDITWVWICLILFHKSWQRERFKNCSRVEFLYNRLVY